MNGAAEAILEELLRESQTQSALLRKLAGGYTGAGTSSGTTGNTSNSGGLSGIVNTMSALNPVLKTVTTAFTAIGKVLNFISGIFSGLGNILTSVVGHLVNLGENLFDFAKQVQEGTGKFSDFLKVFKDLPLVGRVFDFFGNIVKLEETILNQYQKLTSSGASFGGSLEEVRQTAADAGLTLNEFSEIVARNSETFAKMNGSVTDGMKYFAETNKKLIGPNSEYQQAIFGMGYTAEQATGVLELLFKQQGRLGRENLMSSDQMAKKTMEYMTTLDDLTKITGISRDQQMDAIKQEANDAQYQQSLVGKTRDATEKAANNLAAANAAGGKDLADMVKNWSIGLKIPVNDVQKSMMTFVPELQGMLDDITSRVDNGTISAEQSRVYTERTLLRAGQIYNQRTAEQGIQLRASGMAINQSMMNAGRAVGDGANAVENAMTKAAKDHEKSQGSLAGKLGSTEQNVKQLGISMWNFVYRVIEPLMPTILNIGTKLNTFFTDTFSDKSPIVKTLTEYAQKFGDGTLEIATAFFGEGGSIGKGFTSLFKNLSEGLTLLWKEVKNPVMKFWQEDLGPMIEKLFNNIMNFIKPILSDSIKDIIHDVTGLGDSSETRKSRQSWQQTDVYKDWAEKTQKSLGGHGLEQLTLFNGWQPMSEGTKFEKFLRDHPEADNQPPKDQPKEKENRHSGTIGMTGSWWEKNDATLNVKSGESVITPSQMDQIVNTSSQKGMGEALQQLNSLTAQMLHYMKQTADHTRRTYDATKALNGDLFQ